MAVRKPVYFDQALKSFKELSDDQLEILSYTVRKKYASLLATNSSTIGGAISAGASASNYSSVGTIYDTITNTTTRTQTDNTSPPPGADNTFPSTLSSSAHVETQTSYSYRQYIPSNTITNSTFNTYSYLVWNNTIKGLQFEKSTANFFDTIISDCVNQIHTGDRVGSQYFSLSTPTNGTWADLGLVYRDTTYYNTTVNFNRYVKTADSNESNVLNNPSVYKFLSRYNGIVNNNPKLTEIPINDVTNNLITDILAKILEIRHPKYTLTRIGATNSTTAATTTISSYSGTNHGFLYERFVLSGYTLSSVTGPSGGVYTGNYVPDNNSYRYNVWALVPNGNNTTLL